MALRGKLGVDVTFLDSTSATGVKATKAITLQAASEYTAGKAIIVSGTCGTAAVSVPVSPSAYRDAAGGIVSLSAVSWYAFQASALTRCDEAGGDGVAASGAGVVAVSVANGGTSGFSIYSDSGTASYTLVAYGS